jgi:outer membrane protein OmpA-like peptidoglycan-associated protein
LKDYPEIKIEVSGHTDNIGSAEYNKELSENRAKAVVDYLTQNGIDNNRLTYVGFGFEKPLKSNETEEGRQANRRSEFRIIE